MRKPPPIPKLQLEDVKKFVHKLQTFDLQNTSIEVLMDNVSDLMIGYSLRAIFMQQGSGFYRGIKYLEKPSTYEAIIYPPKHFTKINRASAEGEQMFYATSSKRAVFYELKVKLKDRLTISEWESNNKLLFTNVGYTKSNFEALGASVTPFPEADENNIVNHFIADYLSKTFCQNISKENIHLYNLTTAIAKIHLGKAVGHTISGLFYPTIQFNANEDNFAIKKEVIDLGLLNLISIQFIEIIEQIGGRYKYKILDVADECTENINWKNLSKTWTRYDNSEEIVFVEDNNHITTYDPEGNQINPD